jgi:hypothetical protein
MAAGSIVGTFIGGPPARTRAKRNPAAPIYLERLRRLHPELKVEGFGAAAAAA